MPRLNNGVEVLKGVSKVELFSIAPTTPGDTLLTTALTKGDDKAVIASATNFADGNPLFIIGDGGFELNAVDGSPATDLPLKFKAAYDQSVGARVVEAVGRNIGHIDNSGVQYSGTMALTPIDAATSVTPIAYQRGAGALGATFNLRGFNNLNFQLAHGVDEGEDGAGTAADPHQVAIGGTALGTHGLLCARVTGYRFDGKTVTQDYCNVTVEVAVRTNFGGSTPAVLPVTLRFDGVVQRIWQ